jgi:hypothetical protein
MDNMLKFMYCRQLFEKYTGCFEGLMGSEISSEASDSALTRKAAIETEGTRTANRHRWVRRES